MIRQAIIEDLDRLVEIYNQAIEAGHQTAHTEPVTIESRRQWFISHTSEGQLLLIYTENEAVLGYLTLSAYRPGRAALRHTKEVSIYIRQDSQDRGIASALLEHVLSLCPSMEIETLIAIILASNEMSISFFRKYGFEEWGRLPGVAIIDGMVVDQRYLGRRVHG